MQHPHPHSTRRAALSALIATAALVAAGLTALTPGTAEAATARQVEALDRGVISVYTGSGNLVSWRWLGTDPNDVSFNVYRAGTKVNSTPITGSTNYFHSGAPNSADYTVRAVVGGVEQGDSVHAIQFRTGYKDVPITPPAGGTTPTESPTPTRPTTPPSETSTATAHSTSSSSGSRRTPRTTPSPATPATRSSTESSSTAPACGASTSAGTSARARTTRSSRCTTTTATARPRSP